MIVGGAYQVEQKDSIPYNPTPHRDSDRNDYSETQWKLDAILEHSITCLL